MMSSLLKSMRTSYFHELSISYFPELLRSRLIFPNFCRHQTSHPDDLIFPNFFPVEGLAPLRPLFGGVSFTPRQIKLYSLPQHPRPSPTSKGKAKRPLKSSPQPASQAGDKPKPGPANTVRLRLSSHVFCYLVAFL